MGIGAKGTEVLSSRGQAAAIIERWLATGDFQMLGGKRRRKKEADTLT
jgi:hypothetical protein